MNSPAIKRYLFPGALALGLIAYELLFTLLLVFGQPAGTKWLGDTLQNSSDVAVYLSDVRQGAPLLKNLFAVEPHAARFDLFWSALSSVYAWTKTSPILLHEIARALATVLLAFSVHAAARSVAKDEREARLASLLAVGGVGLGWLYSVLTGAAAQGAWKTDGAPDLVTEFAVTPTLLGGAHMILSTALLVYVMRGAWEVIHHPARRAWTVAAAALLLTAFHPYFLPLIAAVIVLAWAKCIRDATVNGHGAHGVRPYGWSRPLDVHGGIFLRPLLLLGALLPAFVYYLWLFRDSLFRAHQWRDNFLPLAAPDRWFFVLLPAALALIWILRSHDRRRLFLKHGRWCLAWIVAAVTLALLLPVPWSRKLTEGLMIPLVFITLPAWSALLGALPRLARGILLAGIAGAAPLHLFASQAAWLADQSRAVWFNRPAAVFRAWSYLESKPGAVIISDDLWTNVWTPAWTDKTVWIGHKHETPDYAQKLAVWKELFSTRDRETVRYTLQTIPVSHLLLTSDESSVRLLPLLPADWSPAFKDKGVIILERR